MQHLYIALVAMAVGYAGFFLILKFLPKRLKSDQAKEREDILEDARRQATSRKKLEVERFDEEAQLLQEQLEAEIHEWHEDLKITEDDLDARERSAQVEESRIQKTEKDFETHKQKTELLRATHEAKVQEVAEMRQQLISRLEEVAGVDATQLRKNLRDTQVESRQIECQKSLKFLDEELSVSSKRLAQRMMARSMARYAPDFYWPKSINFVELADRKLVDKLQAEGQSLIDDMKAKGEIEVELLAGPEFDMPIIKLAGGAGINREAVRLAMTEILAKGPSTWGKAGSFYDRHRQELEQQAIILGRQAIKECQLEGIHPEIQKLVGYLNWRTSYRQNQWYHTVEVAKLAGLLADELGVDPDHAKRVGLLHDIGKALDYRIEGSHAVISGDYADRYGESRLICDTVMSHHNDLIVESPLAYVLRAADTLSGARPGARVNLEEGYQTRLSGIESAVRSFPGVVAVSIMNGAREVHVEVNYKRVPEQEMEHLSQNIARKIEAEVAFPGEIKVLVSRRFEATAVA